MNLSVLPPDTFAWRFRITIVLALGGALAIYFAVASLAGVWGQPPFSHTGLIERADGIVRIVEVVPEIERRKVAGAATNPIFRVDWYASASTVGVMLDAVAGLGAQHDIAGFQLGAQHRRILHFDAKRPAPALIDAKYGLANHPDSHLLAVEAADGSWVTFSIETKLWGPENPLRLAAALSFLLLAIMVASAIATYQLNRPITKFTEALRRFGTDPRAPPMREAGPRELRATIAAFNAMQSQVRRFVTERTVMLAAISHDLRTPLTRMRLRGELIDDDGQRARLFADVDEMQTMVSSALALFQDDFKDEETTAFDLPQMLQTIIDDYIDQGSHVAYVGPTHAKLHGRPHALKRVFRNLIENALKYGKSPALRVTYSTREVAVSVEDEGPGIPAENIDDVFAPFYRLEWSRNRSTGGVGLGLTSARTIVQAHGGEISIRNRTAGGLEVKVMLPLTHSSH